MRFRRRAKRDVLDAAMWYESRQTNLGQQFVQDIDVAVKRISENPQQFPIYEAPARRVLLSRFPYAVYYQTKPLVVLRILHLRRHPDKWKVEGS
jgi:plasmid stabilization system protein ParE